MLFGLTCNAQVKLDSIFGVIDTLPTLQRKLGKMEGIAGKYKLTNKEINLMLDKMRSFEKPNAEFKTIFDIQQSIGIVYYTQNKGNDALKQYFNLLDISEETKNNFYIGMSHDRIAETYQLLKNKAFAEKHLFYSKKYLEKTDSSKQIGELYNLLGTNFKDKGMLDSALKYHHLALDIRLKHNYKKAIAHTYNNLALVYSKLKDYKKAEDYLNKSLEIKIALKDKKGTAGSMINLGDVYANTNRIKQAKENYEKGRLLAMEAKAGKFFKIGTQNLAELLFETGDYKNSAILYVRSKQIADSINEEETNKAIAELTSQYETEKKDSEIAIQQEQLKTQEAENTKQKIMIIASGIALLMMIVAIFFIYRSYKQNKRNARVLAIKNHEIEEKNREITDSINYAKLIQQSLLASKEMLDKNLESYFILYKPKDIVSGDFYWASETNKGFLIACVDCTGHGVPGAFMSLIGKENLDKAVSKTVDPGKILQELNVNVKRSLNQNETSKSRDGMDAAVLRVQKNADGSAVINYAGANRPLYILRQNTQTIEEVKATKQAVGGFTSIDQVYEQHQLIAHKGDTLVITTDGYADQFGSDKNKKLTTKRFKELLVTIQAKQASDQKNKLENFFNDWKGKNEQLDDLLVIGITI